MENNIVICQKYKTCSYLDICKYAKPNNFNYLSSDSNCYNFVDEKFYIKKEYDKYIRTKKLEKINERR